jgi:TonB-linked SusC/RagA family outer membrane protein
MYQFQINYARQFGLHNVGAMALVKREEYAMGSMFKNYREDWVSRVTYDYNSRYLLELNGAYNGSEKFGPGYRFDFFPSAAAGWYVSNEKFFKLDWVNRLKLRYSIGMVGDDQGGGRWLYDSQYTYGGYSEMNANPKGVSPYTWYSESVVGNPDIHWEKAKKSNYGLEIGLLDNLVSVNYDYFTEDRTDVLLGGTSRTSIPAFFGATAPSANVGAVKSNGHELEVRFEKRTSFGLYYWANASVTHTENEIIKREDPALYSAYAKLAGYPIGQSRTLVRTEFYNNWDEIFASVPTETNDLQKLPGYYDLIDFNTDGVIKESEDVIPYGYSEVPENTYNCTLGAEYKGFSIMLQFYGVNNVSRYYPLQNYYFYQTILYEHSLDYWSKDNEDASSFLPRYKTLAQNIGDYYLYDGSYIRLKSAEIAYSLQDKVLKKIGLSSLRIFLNGNNLFFWSKLPDDKEAAWSEGGNTIYPTPRRFNLGLDLTF